jgi:hypothetical protein
MEEYEMEIEHLEASVDGYLAAGEPDHRLT